MKKLIIIILICSFKTLSIAQTVQNCDQLKKELLKTQDENKYLKNSLKINEPIKEITSDKINFKLIKVEGNSKTQTITMTVVLKTNAANWYIMSSVNSIIDIDGNEYKLKSYTVGASDFRSINLNTDVPIKCTYTFGGVLPAVKIIKLFNFEYTHSAGEPYSAEFRDLTVDWK